MPKGRSSRVPIRSARASAGGGRWVKRVRMDILRWDVLVESEVDFRSKLLEKFVI
jgi:hypothetical protein